MRSINLTVISLPLTNHYLVYKDLVECVSEVEQRKEALKKQYAQKFQWMINNYGLMNFRIDQFE
jgi:hypothetical protein